MTQKTFLFQAVYQTRHGNIGSARMAISADSIEAAEAQGIARTQKRKSYARALDATTYELPD
jgi:hypothetical protein